VRGFIARAKRRRRHRTGCYRWYGDGRCVDCRRYTGTARDAAAGLLDGEIVFCRFTDPDVEPIDDLARRALDDADHGAQPLTADQEATRLAWRKWRIAQGDPQPHIPRRRRQSGGTNRR